MAWEDTVMLSRCYREGIRKAKMQMELNLARDAKNNKKGLYRYIDQKRQTKESESPSDK